MKLLLMAYECSPYRGSEWAVGWGRLLGAAKAGPTHVITSEANFAALERARAEGLIPADVTFHTPEPDARLRAMEKKPGIFAYNYRAYHHWQELAVRMARELHARENFDLVHQVNVCTFREPGYGWQLGIPFLWGPVGGTQNFPMRFLPMLPWKEAVKEGVRGVSNWLALRKPRVRTAAKHATMLFGANSTNRRDLSSALGSKVEYMLESGLHEVLEPNRARYERRLAAGRAGSPQAPLRLLWSGELHTRKALPVLLQALVLLGNQVAWELDVLGDGPMRDHWIAQTARLGLSGHVRFLGRRPYREAVAAMHSADVLCFTSLRDTSGNVVLEAMAAGVPVICFDHQGAGDIVSEISGIKIPVGSPSEAYKDWSCAIRNLAENPRKLFALSRGATLQARRFLWSDNQARMNAIYARVAEKGSRSAAAEVQLAAEEVFKGAVAAAHGSSH